MLLHYICMYWSVVIFVFVLVFSIGILSVSLLLEKFAYWRFGFIFSGGFNHFHQVVCFGLDCIGKVMFGRMCGMIQVRNFLCPSQYQI